MLIFSDVDGTLLDTEGSCPLPAPVLEGIASRHQVVLTSSRYADELYLLQSKLGLPGPVIAEDGSVVAGPDGEVSVLGTPRAELLERLATALGEAERSRLLALEPAEQRARLASILLPSRVARPELTIQLRSSGLSLTAGGKWATVTAGSDKGRAAVHVAASLGVGVWMAIGDSGNDAPLLEAASAGFVIRRPEGHHPMLARIPGVTLLENPGPFGWVEMLGILRSSDRQGD